MIKFFFVDFDGTVINSKKRVYDLFIHLTKLEVGFDDYWAIKNQNKSNHDVLNLLQIDIDNVLPNFKKDWFELIESKEFLKKDTLFDSSKLSLEILAQKGKVFLVTSRQFKENVKWQLKHLKIDQYFTDIIVTEHKDTKPLILQKWLSNIILPISLQNGYMIGDTEEDYKTGELNNLQTVAVFSGFRSEDYLRNLPFNHFYDSVYYFCKSL